MKGSGAVRVGSNLKYASHNPISRFLVRNFCQTIKSYLREVESPTVLEVGCGDGLLMRSLADELKSKHCVVGIDIDLGEIEVARSHVDFAELMLASAYNLPFADSQFDLVLCCEVLEHLQDPVRALREIRRVGVKYCILTVPNEPIWRVLNMLRGAYLTRLGNTPGHINHWSRRTFSELVDDYFEVQQVKSPLPWVAVLCHYGDDPKAEKAIEIAKPAH